MKLSSKNIFARYYKWIYSELPQDICTFFWGTIAIIITFMVVVPGRLVNFNEYRPEYWDNFKTGCFTYLVYLISMVFGVQILGYEKGDPIQNMDLFLWGPLAFLGIAVSIIGLVVLTGWVIHMIMERQRQKRRENNPYVPHQEEGPSKTSLWIGAIRKKHCTKIEWK